MSLWHWHSGDRALKKFSDSTVPSLGSMQRATQSTAKLKLAWARWGQGLLLLVAAWGWAKAGSYYTAALWTSEYTKQLMSSLDFKSLPHRHAPSHLSLISAVFSRADICLLQQRFDLKRNVLRIIQNTLLNRCVGDTALWQNTSAIIKPWIQLSRVKK